MTDFSRRDFLQRAGRLSAALSLFGPGIGHELFTNTIAHAPVDARDLANGIVGTNHQADHGRILSGYRWRLIGPYRGGRVAAACGVPSRPNHFYFGAVNGGVWKTLDAGRTWQPVFDSQPVASIGAVAVAPSAPDVVYVGSGESTPRDSVGYGNGVYKSIDAGKTWTHVGLDETQHIGKIAVDPKNPNVLFVAAMGKMYAASPERGVFRSRDGGKTWQKVLYKNPDVGAVEVVIDPTNSNVVYAGLWNTRRPPWYTYAPTNGPGGGLYKSIDGGNTWKELTNGLPPKAIGRSGIAVAPTNPRRVYAVIDCLEPEQNAPAPAAGGRGGANAACGAQSTSGRPGQGGFFRSDDAGATWTRLSGDPALWGRGWYFEKLAIDPRDADTVYVSNVSVSRSRDGGKTWVPLRGSPGGDDYHQPWVSPDDSDTMIVASDQGCVITRNARAEDPRDVTWSSWLNQPTAQMYHISVDYRSPYWVTGAQQDNGAVAVRSRGKFAEITMRDWEPIGAGGESGYTAGDIRNPGVVFGGSGQRYDLDANQPILGTTAPQTPGCARTDWTQPLVFSKADPSALYYSNQYVYKTTDGARTWTQISADLTRPDPGIPSNLDATAADHTDRNGKRGVVYTIAPSPLVAPLVWVGTDDGLIHVTDNDGKSWQNVTPPAVTAWSRVTMIDASHFDANTAYASVDRHQLQDFTPYIYRTRDRGKTWTLITKNLPPDVYVHVVKEDPIRRGMLVAGTERGAFISFDDGDSWESFQLNLPVTSVRDYQLHDGDIIVGTHGRGIWVLDDASALRQMDDAILASEAYLFKPADATYLVHGGDNARPFEGDNGTPTQKDEAVALNPPNGAIIDYYIGSAGGPVKLEILNAAGTVVQTFSQDAGAAGGGTAGGGATGRGRGGIPNTMIAWRPEPEPFVTTPGMHRVVWEPVPAPTGRGGGGGGRGGDPVVLTGAFTARLTAGGKTYTQSFVVKPELPSKNLRVQ